ncbi:MAG: phenylalanine--tRNA ligase subunit beta, partial [Desulfovibrio sp.]|nr:phenylalanine--tRNA ligase subunit beta [Desulfovibrio sp.]
MLVPISWLREFTPYEGTVEALGDRLTMLGLELEEIINPFAGLGDIVVGFVAQCQAHPDSDHLHCCKVDIGQGALVDIVCGAPNVAQGQKVAVAPPGATLPDGTRIKPSRLRGQPSNGMICSERELGLSEDHSGILVLPESADVGHGLIQALELDTEVLDLSITPNRADCLSILGIARETAAACHLPLRVPELPLIPDHDSPEIEVPVSILAPDLCWLYSGRVITGASIGQAPMRMRYRLHAVGVRAISNIVDATNYVMLECGQPLHAFDLDKLEGRKIIVRQAGENERLTTLDGRERQLTGEDLCICDGERPIALAGVMGGLDSEITASSRNVFLESAVFQPRSIRRTSRRLGLQSEASFRYERGIDQTRSVWALDRACALMASISGGFVRRGFSIAEPRPFVPVRIDFAPRAADALLGVEIEPESQAGILSGLGCAVEKQNAQKWVVIQPSWRPDLTREADLIEEVGRVYGLDKIEPRLPEVVRSLKDSLNPGGPYEFGRLVRAWGAGLGLHEAINYSFVGDRDLDALNLAAEKRLAIFNPLSEDQNTL